MNSKQAFVTLLLLIILLYIGLYGIINNFTGNHEIHHYILFIINIIPASSFLVGLLIRVLLGRSTTSKKFILSAIFSTITTVVLIFIYILSYSQWIMVDIPGIIVYCLILNFILLILNSIISLMGLERIRF
jgi:hypothetical protein